MMRPQTSNPREGGFTLIEAMVTIVIAAVLITLGVPALHAVMAQRRLQGFAHTIAMLNHRARHEALKRGAPTVVTLADGEMIAFADIDDDGTFDPDPLLPDGTDYVIGRHAVPNHLVMGGPSDGPAVDGLSLLPSGDRGARFDTDGSVRAIGSFRLRDVRENYLEVHIEPQATARIELRKWNGSGWLANGEGGSTWDWN